MQKWARCVFRAHTLTMEYVEKFGLKTNDFTMDNPNAYYYMGGKAKSVLQKRMRTPHYLVLMCLKTKGNRRATVYEGDLAADRQSRKNGDLPGMRSSRNMTNIPRASFLKSMAGLKA